MLRALVAALLVANLAFWAWTQGWLDGVAGRRAVGDREPERMSQQVHPEAVKTVALPGSAAPAPAPAPAVAAPVAAAVSASAGPSPGASAAAEPAAVVAAFGPDCLEAGPFTPDNVDAAESALMKASLPTDSWANVATDIPGVWLVYMGRFSDAEQLARKEDELRRLRVGAERLSLSGEAQPGLVLGRYPSRSQADDAMGLLQMRGVKSARVVAFSAPQTTHVLRFEKPDAALKAQLVTLKSAALGTGFVRCGTAGSAPAPRTP